MHKNVSEASVLARISAMRSRAIKRTSHVPEHENLEVLERVVTSDPENRVRAAAVEAIGELRAGRSEEVLRGVIEADPEERIKRAAEEALEDLQRGGFEGD